jgi:hypothetical protein
MRLDALQSLISVEVTSLLGWPVPAMTSLFPADLRGVPSMPAPGFLRNRVHPLLRLSPLQSSSPLEPARITLAGVRAPSLRFPSPSRHQCFESTLGEDPIPLLCSALSVSRALDGLLLDAPCGLVSSHCHVRDSLFRGFPHCQASISSSPCRPLLSLPTFASS